MKKILTVLTALLLVLLSALPAYADIAPDPVETARSMLPYIIVVILAITLVALAAALIIRAIMDKKKGKK